MSYGYNNYREYEFTAFAGSDLLTQGDTQLSCGDTFTVPFSATACITVSDNDSKLSGDAWRNEQGDDRSGQIADIEVDGQLVSDSVKIYAERYTVVQDQNGKCYYLIEIEIAGSASDDNNDFFAFYNGTPPAGSELTVVSTGNVCGNWLSYKKLDAGLKWDLDDDGKLTIEAEDMALSGYRVDDIDDASGGEVIKLKKKEGQAEITFGAESGTYDLELAYVDENDGQGSIVVEVNGVVVQTILLDQDNNGNGNDHSTISSITIEDLELTQGDVITLRGTRDDREFARIDALTFCLNKEPVAGDDNLEMSESGLVVADLLENDTDPNGDTLTIIDAGGNPVDDFFMVQSTGGRTANILVNSTGNLNFAADTNGNFEDLAEGETDTITVEYTISDGTGGTSTATITVTVNGENDDPNAVDDLDLEVDEGELFTGSLLANDTDTDATDELKITSANGNALVVTTPGGSASASFVATSALGYEADVFIGESGMLDVAVAQTDPRFETLAEGETDTVTITYDISDGNGGTDSATAIITIDGLNDDPDAMDDGFTMTESQLYANNLLANDTDIDASDVLQITSANGSAINPALGGATLFSLTSAGGRDAEIVVTENFGANFVVNPKGEFEDLALGETDTLTFTYDITDGNNGVDTATVTVTITGENDDPDAVDDLDLETDEGVLFSGSLLANDTDADGTDELKITSANGVALAPTSPGGSASASFVAVSALGFDADVFIGESGMLDVAVAQTDPRFDSIALGETDIVTITYEITDGNGGTDSATAVLTINGLNDGPTAVDDLDLEVDEGELFTTSLLANDTDPDTTDELRITAANGVALAPTSPGGSASASIVIESALRYDADVFVGASGMLDLAVVQSDPDFETLALGETDTVTLTYDISDGNGGTSSATALLTINGLNDDPTAVDDAFTVDEGEVLSGSLLGNDFDIDASDTIKIVSAGGNALAPQNPGSLPSATFVVESAGGRQASVFVAESGMLDIAVVQGQTFFELAEGETDTITVSYEIQDNNGATDTATAVITVVGDGPASATANFTANTPNTGQEVSISLVTDSTTSDGTVDAEIDINFGAVLQPEINVVYVIDTSGSTIASVLDIEKAALQALTADIAAQGFPDGSVSVTVIPFSTTSAPDATGDAVSTFTIDTSDDAGSTDVNDINAAINGLTGGGFTNYVEALGAAEDALNSLDPTNSDTNVVYFLSDGQPTVRDPITNQITTQTEAQIAAAAAPVQAIAQISAFEIGNVDALQFLDALDNTGGAESVSNPNDLSAALLGSPIPDGTVIAADLILFDDSETFGTIVDTIEFDIPGGTDDPANPNLVETPLGLEIDLQLSGLASDLGDANRATLVVQFDDDGDGIVDLPLLVEVDIFGTAV